MMYILGGIIGYFGWGFTGLVVGLGIVYILDKGTQSFKK